MISTTTVLVALLSGAAGALLGKVLEAHYERSRDFRTWYLSAAADYTTGVSQAMIALRTAYDALLEHGTARPDGHVEVRDPKTDQVRPQISGPLQLASERVDDAHSRMGRVHILFGAETGVGEAASNALVALRAAEQALKDWPVPDLNAYKAAFGKAFDAHNAFNGAVLSALQPRPLHRRVRARLPRPAG